MFNAIMFEDCTIYWSLSRPMLSLIFYNRKFYQDIQDSIIGNQSRERQPMFQDKFTHLMDDITTDKLTQVLHIYIYTLCMHTFTFLYNRYI